MKFRIVILILGLCILSLGLALAAETNTYWRVDLNQGSSIIAYGQGATEEAAWTDCRRLRATTRAMTAAETRKAAVSAVTSSVVRWCKNPMQYATVAPDPVIPPPPVREARLSWTPPTRNTDGTALANLSGYRIHYGTSATALSQTIQVGAVSTYTVTNLAPGTYYFAVRAITSNSESDLSNTISKVVP